MALAKAYLDTCVISAQAKSELSADDQSAFDRLLVFVRRGDLELITSAVAGAELDQIPAMYRAPHIAVYELFASATRIKPGGVTRLGLTGTSSVNPKHQLWLRIRDTLPDQADAEHAFVACSNGATILLTLDQRTILSKRKQLEAVSGLRAMRPFELVAELGRRAT